MRTGSKIENPSTVFYQENHESYNFYYSAFCVTWSTWSAVCSLIMSLMYPGSVAKKRVMSTVRRTRVVALSALDQNPPHVNRLGPVMWGRTQFRGEVGWGDFRGIRGEFRSCAPDLSIFLLASAAEWNTRKGGGLAE